MKRLRSSRVKDGGFSLVEILVAITLFVVVATVTGTLIVKANQTTRKATESTVAQAQLLDTISRMSRDIAMSDPITIAEEEKLETLTVQGANAVRSRFWYDAASKEIRTMSSKSPLATNVVPVLSPIISTGYKVVAKNIIRPAGGNLLAYVDASSNPMPDRVTGLDLAKVARVKINLNATVKDRSKPLTMTTSMATRLMPAGVSPIPGMPQLKCPSVTATSTLTTVSLSWLYQYGALTFDISRNGVVLGNQAALVLNDTGLATGTEYVYTIIPQGSGASPTAPCVTSITTKMSPPVLGGMISPSPYLATRAYAGSNLTWPQVMGATGYTLVRGDGTLLKEFDVPLPPFTTAMTYVDPLRIPGVTYTYRVYARNLWERNPGVPSHDLALTPDPLPPVVGAYPSGPQANALFWNGEEPGAPVLNHWTVSRSLTQVGGYTEIDTVTTQPTTVTPYKDPSVLPLGKQYFYQVKAYRTAAATPGASSNSISNVAVQYPAVPATLTFAKGAPSGYSGNLENVSVTPHTLANRVKWAAAEGATKGYNVYYQQGTEAFRFSKQVTGLLADHPATWGSRTTYYAAGVNTCHVDPDDPLDISRSGVATPDCTSPNRPGGGVTQGAKAEIYQRPGRPDPDVYAGYPTGGTNYSALTLDHNGDYGNPDTAKFCTAAICTFTTGDLRRTDDGDSGRAVTPTITPYGTKSFWIEPPYDNEDEVGVSHWGRTFGYTVRTHNPGGTSDWSGADVTETFPGPFSVTSFENQKGYSYKTTVNGGFTESRQYEQSVTWALSSGTDVEYNYHGVPSWSGENYSVQGWDSSPGTVHSYSITAKADNDLTRTIGYKIQTAPGTVSNIQARWMCSPDEDKWKVAYVNVDTKVTGGLDADVSRWDKFTITGALFPDNNSDTDGDHVLVAATHFAAPNISWPNATYPAIEHTADLPNTSGSGGYMVFDNFLNAEPGMNKWHNYSIGFGLGTTRGASVSFEGCTSGGWDYVMLSTANYPDGADPRQLHGYNP